MGARCAKCWEAAQEESQEDTMASPSPTGIFTNYEGVKVPNHVLAVFRRNAEREAYMPMARRVERMLDTLYYVGPYGSRLEGWGYENCVNARRVLYRWLRVFGGEQ